eukprot:208690-Amphidinium_carterae.1
MQCHQLIGVKAQDLEADRFWTQHGKRLRRDMKCHGLIGLRGLRVADRRLEGEGQEACEDFCAVQGVSEEDIEDAAGTELSILLAMQAGCGLHHEDGTEAGG